MSIFQEFSPIFRLVNDYERASRCQPRVIRTFKPNFDVKELQDSYEVQGELAGIDQKNVNIKWSDATTLIIKGHTEHRAQKATPPKPNIASESSETEERKSHQPTVEEEGETSPSDDFVEVDSHTQEEVVKDPETSVPAAEAGKYWVTERPVGNFHRSFTFPIRVDQDAVKASLKNGILSIVVPKAKIPEPRKIVIE